MSFIDFEHKLLKELKDKFKNLSGQNIYIGCSGGADSVALFRALNKINPILKAKISMIHIHHGKALGEQGEFRDKAVSFCEALAKESSCEFICEKSEESLVSEEDCRDFRHYIFEKYENVFLAQHSDDFTETLLLRMIRGTGPQGLVNPFSKNFNRPFLEGFSRQEILTYLEAEEQIFLEDPSNSDDSFLRNWLRLTWLPDLEKKRGISGLRTSLKLLHEELKEEKADTFSSVKFDAPKGEGGSFSCSYWLNLNRFQKQSTIAHVLLKVIKTGYTKGQVDEVLKHLDLPEKETTLRVGGLYWKKKNNHVHFSKI
ncbi:MAG: tRNA lysidine(34) synthetase TilS [Bdellovibrionales bacterium]